MNVNDLIQALQYSITKAGDEIKLAEKFIQEASTQNGYITNLLVIACNKDLTIHVRQAAVVNLSNAVKKAWTQKTKDVQHEDKTTLKDNILEAMIKCADQPKIYKQIIEIIKHIAAIDFPERWGNILENIVGKIRDSNDFQEVYGALLALYALFYNYQESLGVKPMLEELVNATFGFLETFARKLLDDYGVQAASALQIILKIFFSSTYTSVPEYLFNEKNLETWMTFFKLVLDNPISAELESQTTNQRVIAEREKNIYWRNKKLCSKIITKLHNKYRNITAPNEKTRSFSQIFQRTYSLPFLETNLKILQKSKEQYVYVKVQFYAMSFINKLINDKELRNHLKDHLEFILFDIVIPGIYLTAKDEEDWEENPVEFIRGEEDLMERPNNLKTVSSHIVQKICDKKFTIDGAHVGHAILVKFMKHAAAILSQNVDPRTNQPADTRLREAILHIIGLIQSQILDNKEIAGQMEFLLAKFVVPELVNESNILKYRACWLFGAFAGGEFKDVQVIKAATENLCKCLLIKQLPLQVQASIALERVLEHDAALEIIRPELGEILKIYINLIASIDHEFLVSALEGLINKFGDSIGPYAIELIQSLGQIFAKSVDDDEEDENGDGFDLDEKQLAASGCLSAISNILNCKLTKETILGSLEIVIPLLKFTLIDDRTDNVEEGLGILNSVLYGLDVIPESLWHFYLELCYMLSGKPESVVAPNGIDNLSDAQKILVKHKLEGWGQDYSNLMSPCFQNYIQKGRNVIFTERDPLFNLTYIELLFKSIDKLFVHGLELPQDIEAAPGLLLYVTLIENYPGEINNLISYFLDKVVEGLNKTKNSMIRKALIQVVALCLWYDVNSTLQYLNSKGAIEGIFKLWIGMLDSFKHDYECERVMMGLASIFRANIAELPDLVRMSLPGLIQKLIPLSSRILVLRVEDINSKGDDDDEEDEEDFLGIDDDDDDKVMERTFKKLEKFHAQNGTPFVDKEVFDKVGFNNIDDDDADDLDAGAKFDDYKALEWLQGEGKYDSPFDGQCEIKYLQESLELMQRNQPDAYTELTNCLSEEEKTTLQGNFGKAHEQWLEYHELQKQGF